MPCAVSRSPDRNAAHHFPGITSRAPHQTAVPEERPQRNGYSYQCQPKGILTRGSFQQYAAVQQSRLIHGTLFSRARPGALRQSATGPEPARPSVHWVHRARWCANERGTVKGRPCLAHPQVRGGPRAVCSSVNWLVRIAPAFRISIGYEVQRFQGLLVGMGWSALIAVCNWPFAVLYFVTRWRARKRWPKIGLIKTAMCGSAIAMSIPNLPILLGTPGETLSGARDAGQGSGIWLGLELFPLPVLGAIGWALGALAALGWRSWSGKSRSGV
jgi:hypothetical protein